MSKGNITYKDLIDTLAKMSPKSVDAKHILNGGSSLHGDTKLKEILATLSDEARKVLAEKTADAYMAGIFDTLAELEWRVDCRDMKIFQEGVEVPLDDYEGLKEDFIGRIDDWEWPDE